MSAFSWRICSSQPSSTAMRPYQSLSKLSLSASYWE